MTPTPVQPDNNELFGLPGYVPTQDERNMAIFCHLGPMLFGFLVPLIIMLTKGKESAWVRAHAVESLNFSITLGVAMILSVALAFVVIGFCLIPVIGIGALVFHILATIAASGGRAYRYPVNVRLVS